MGIDLKSARAQLTAETEQESRQDAGGDGRTTVLVVDDEPMVLRVCRRVLERAGHRVLTASGAEQAIGVLQNSDGCIDVLLCDVVMPDVCGGELADELRTLEPEMEVIFFSGYLGDANTRCQIDEGSARFLAKPFGTEELVRLIDEVVADE